jgi:hypothetical protein
MGVCTSTRGVPTRGDGNIPIGRTGTMIALVYVRRSYRGGKVKFVKGREPDKENKKTFRAYVANVHRPTHDGKPRERGSECWGKRKDNVNNP